MGDLICLFGSLVSAIEFYWNGSKINLRTRDVGGICKKFVLIVFVAASWTIYIPGSQIERVHSQIELSPRGWERWRKTFASTRRWRIVPQMEIHRSATFSLQLLRHKLPQSQGGDGEITVCKYNHCLPCSGGSESTAAALSDFCCELWMRNNYKRTREGELD